jgi:hypothetical protein
MDFKSGNKLFYFLGELENLDLAPSQAPLIRRVASAVHLLPIEQICLDLE